MPDDVQVLQLFRYMSYEVFRLRVPLLVFADPPDAVRFTVLRDRDPLLVLADPVIILPDAVRRGPPSRSSGWAYLPPPLHSVSNSASMGASSPVVNM